MTTLRIRWLVTNGDVVPQQYELHDSDTMLSYVQPRKRYYNIAHRMSDANAFDTCSLWFRRKIDFSDMNDGETKEVNNVYAKGTITAVSGIKNIAMDNEPLQAIGWSKQLLLLY